MVTVQRSRTRRRNRNQASPPPPIPERVATFIDKSTEFLQELESFQQQYRRMPSSRRRRNGRVVTTYDDALFRVEQYHDRAYEAYAELNEQELDHPAARARFNVMRQKADTLTEIVDAWTDIAEEEEFDHQIHQRD